MDTFFFVHVDILSTGERFRFGPYATLGAAAEIMMDMMPIIIHAETLTPSPKYKATISEWIVNDGAWERLTIKATETR